MSEKLSDFLQNNINIEKEEKDVILHPKIHKTPRKTNNKLETKFNELSKKFEKMELYLKKHEKESELLAECALRFRDLISWKRFSADTPYGKKLADLLFRIESRN